MATPWDVKFFKRHQDDDRQESVPALEFLEQCPEAVAADLFAILRAVATGPPPQFRGGGMWEAMHGDMRGHYEARVRGPGRRLYRLFCLERTAPGLSGPAVIVIAGRSKPLGTAFRSADYDRVRRLSDEYRQRVPRSVAYTSMPVGMLLGPPISRRSEVNPIRAVPASRQNRVKALAGDSARRVKPACHAKRMSEFLDPVIIARLFESFGFAVLGWQTGRQGRRPGLWLNPRGRPSSG